jgi:hypothetical protein
LERNRNTIAGPTATTNGHERIGAIGPFHGRRPDTRLVVVFVEGGSVVIISVVEAVVPFVRVSCEEGLNEQVPPAITYRLQVRTTVLGTLLKGATIKADVAICPALIVIDGVAAVRVKSGTITLKEVPARAPAKLSSPE